MITPKLSPSLRSVNCIHVFLQIFREIESFATDMTVLPLRRIDIAVLLHLVRFERGYVFGARGLNGLSRVV